MVAEREGRRRMADLKSFYDGKYGRVDDAVPEIAEIRHTTRPATRYEGVLACTPKSGGRLLEIGAGAGWMLAALAGGYESLIGLELSEARVFETRAALSSYENIKMLQCDVEGGPLPFPDGYFETIIFSATIEHLVDPIAVLRECRRVVAADGCMILDTPNIAKWTRRTKLLFGWFPATASKAEGLQTGNPPRLTTLHDEGHFHYFTFRSLGRIAREFVGFTRVEWGRYGSPWILVRLRPTMFSEGVLLVCRP
jgi:SAM-dependent methyltransferase